MKRFLPCLAALALGILTPQANAQSNDPVDPIGDLIQDSISQSVVMAGSAPVAVPAMSAPAEAAAKTPGPVERAFTAMAPDWMLKATLYHGGAKGVGGRDSLGCATVAMRTAATDRTLVPRRTILFIKETVGMPMADGGTHDGYWYASDVGGAVKGSRIDLFTGNGRGSMQHMMKLNLKTLTVSKVGTFDGCPKADMRIASR